MRIVIQTQRCWTKYSGRYSSLTPVNKIPGPRAGIITVSGQMATSGVVNRFLQHRLQMAMGVATYIISSSMSVFGASVQRTNLVIMSLLTSNTPGGITTCIEHTAMRTTRQLMTNTHRAMFSEDSTCFDIFPVSWATSLSPTSSIQCISACLTTSRSGFSTAWRCTNASTSTMQSGYLCLLTMTSHQKITTECKGDAGNEPVPAWSCYPVLTRRKPQSMSHT